MFYNFGLIINQSKNENLGSLFYNFAQNRQFMDIFSTPKERRERGEGLIERLKICPEPPKPPPRPPNKIELFLKLLHHEAIVATREIISASMASFLAVAATQPLDVLKMEYLSKPGAVGPWYTFFFRHRFLHEIRKIAASRGYTRFYRGHFEAQRESLFQTISMFYTYQRVNEELDNIESLSKTYPNLCIFLSGFFSASISVLLLRPYATLQDQLSNKRQLLQKVGPICAAYTLKQRTRWSSIFKGCFADFMYTGTQYGLRFLIYHITTEKILERKPETTVQWDEYFRSEDSTGSEFAPKKPIKTLTNVDVLFAGAISGLLSDVATHPMDVINSRLKTQALARQLYSFEDNCHKYGQCMRTIWNKSKFRGFYLGFFPILMKSAISTGVTFAAYEAVHEWLQRNFLDG